MTDTCSKHSSAVYDVGEAASPSDQCGDWLAFFALVASHAVFNLIFGPMGVFGGDFYSGFVAISVIMMQPVFFAMWAALGPQPAFHRIP